MVIADPTRVPSIENMLGVNINLYSVTPAGLLLLALEPFENMDLSYVSGPQVVTIGSRIKLPNFLA